MSTFFPQNLPPQFAAFGDREWTEVTLGESGAGVWRIHGGGETLFLKHAPVHPLSEMPGEVARLNWLASTPVPAPRVREYVEVNDTSWLLMTALPGRDLTELTGDPARLCHVLASGLRAMHALDVAGCPFDHRLAPKLSLGTANVAAGLVDETDFDDAYDGWTASAVLDWLLAHQPSNEDLVVAHGDASLPNIMAENGNFSGIIDCGRLGVADRWQDLAIACRSIIFNCGEAHVPTFLAAYGADWDEERFRYYCALDELF